MRRRAGIAAFVTAAGVTSALAAGAVGSGAQASVATPGLGNGSHLIPGDLLVSTSYYTNDPNIVAGQTILPPGSGSAGQTAIAGGDYPYVFNNDSVDGSFGVTSKLELEEITPWGLPQGVIQVPDSDLVTSFSSKSEGALNLSSDGKYLSFIDYVAAPDTIDASNANTPGVIDPTNPVTGAYYRAVATLSANGKWTFTETNAYSGNNGRAAVEAKIDGKYYIYTAGNAGNGANPQPSGVVLGAGAQIITPSSLPESAQTPGQPTPVGSFNITELPGVTKADKVGKDDNFRGLALYNNVLYYTKGSGGNGVDTVYFLDTTGTACPNGTGLPVPGAPLPTTDIAASLTSAGLSSNMCILKGFPTVLAKSATDASDYPFGLWFANPTTLYVADEGAGDNAYSATSNSYTAAAASTTAGLQKWVYNSTAGEWQLAYTLQNGLRLGTPYTVAGYPTGVNSVTGLPWAPATGGLRNITVTIWGVTSTVSGGGDQGADPNQLVAVTDPLGATSAPAYERFFTVVPARYDQVVRGVSFTPGPDHGNF
jgi:hypothetical protein